MLGLRQQMGRPAVVRATSATASGAALDVRQEREECP
jgi:hypothetical protein